MILAEAGHRDVEITVENGRRPLVDFVGAGLGPEPVEKLAKMAGELGQYC